MVLPADKTLEELFKFRLMQLKADSEYATSAISQLTRVIAYGLVALIIPFVAAEPDKMPLIVKHHPRMVFFAALLGSGAVVSDFLQNFFADKCARQELDRLTSNLSRTGMVVSLPSEFMAPTQRSWVNIARRQCYQLKVGFAAVGTALIFVTILVEVLIGSGGSRSFASMLTHIARRRCRTIQFSFGASNRLTKMFSGLM